MSEPRKKLCKGELGGERKDAMRVMLGNIMVMFQVSGQTRTMD